MTAEVLGFISQLPIALALAGVFLVAGFLLRGSPSGKAGCPVTLPARLFRRLHCYAAGGGGLALRAGRRKRARSLRFSRSASSRSSGGSRRPGCFQASSARCSSSNVSPGRHGSCRISSSASSTPPPASLSSPTSSICRSAASGGVRGRRHRVGLALQSTLGDVFSGVVLNLAKPYHPSDWIILDGGTEGRVVLLSSVIVVFLGCVETSNQTLPEIDDDRRKPLARYGAMESALRERLAPSATPPVGTRPYERRDRRTYPAALQRIAARGITALHSSQRRGAAPPLFSSRLAARSRSPSSR